MRDSVQTSHCEGRPRTGVVILLVGASLVISGCTSTKSKPHPRDLGRLLSSKPAPPAPCFVPLPQDERSKVIGNGIEPYRLGPGDVINIQGLGEQFRGFGETTKGEIAGTKIKPDGRLYLPQLGPVDAAGRTVLEVQDAIREALKRFNKEPFVSVDVLVYRSQKYFILGEVESPGVSSVDGETTLLEAIAKAGGFTKQADVEQAFIVRNQRILPVSLADIVRRGDMTQNLVLRDKDLVFVPDNRLRRVFVLGEVARVGVFPLSEDGMTLVEAIALAGGLRPESADVNQVRVFRGGWSTPEVYTISACELYTYGEDIALFPGDRVFVAPTTEATYARALSLIAPLVTTPLSVATTAVAVEAYAR